MLQTGSVTALRLRTGTSTSPGSGNLAWQLA